MFNNILVFIFTILVLATFANATETNEAKVEIDPKIIQSLNQEHKKFIRTLKRKQFFNGLRPGNLVWRMMGGPNLNGPPSIVAITSANDSFAIIKHALENTVMSMPVISELQTKHPMFQDWIDNANEVWRLLQRSGDSAVKIRTEYIAASFGMSQVPSLNKKLSDLKNLIYNTMLTSSFVDLDSELSVVSHPLIRQVVLEIHVLSAIGDKRGKVEALSIPEIPRNMYKNILLGVDCDSYIADTSDTTGLRNHCLHYMAKSEEHDRQVAELIRNFPYQYRVILNVRKLVPKNIGDRCHEWGLFPMANEVAFSTMFPWNGSPSEFGINTSYGTHFCREKGNYFISDIGPRAVYELFLRAMIVESLNYKGRKN